jgi:ribulose-phosphate 3-epimerase
MRISASISSLQKRQIPDTVSMLDQAGVNFYHLDSVENREIFDFAKSLGEITKTPMDLHLITSDPVKYWDEIRESGIEAIVIQLEALHSTLIIPDDMRGKVGLAILATSSPELFKPYEKVASSLLIMTTTPGYSGGKFQKEQFANIMRFRFMYPKVPLIVDGGVTAEISSVLTFMGIPQVVSGSYLFSAETVFETVSKLRDKPIAKWTVSDISLSEPELLQGFSLRLPETVPFINQNAQFETIDLPDHWLNAVGGKSVAMQFGPFPIVWVDDRIDADSFRIQLTNLKEQPHLAITVNENNDVSGFICLTNFN